MLSIFYSILSHLINLCLKLLLCISALALSVSGLSYVDESCAWSTASVIKLSAESAVPRCNSCWWWTWSKQILPSSSSRTHSSLPVPPALPCSAHSAISADGSGRRRGDDCKHTSWGSNFNRVTALASKKSKKQAHTHTKPQMKTTPNWALVTNWAGHSSCAVHLHSHGNCRGAGASRSPRAGLAGRAELCLEREQGQEAPSDWQVLILGAPQTRELSKRFLSL